MKHSFPYLNVSYVLTASDKFLNTLDNIVKGLNRAGFSDKDYKLASSEVVQEIKKEEELQQLDAFFSPIPESTETAIDNDVFSDIDTSRIVNLQSVIIPNEHVEKIDKMVIEQDQEMEKIISDMEVNNTPAIPTAIQKLVKTYHVNEMFQEKIAEIKLPQFYIKRVKANLFGSVDSQLLEKNDLLEDFQLSKANTNITFDNIKSELYKVDIDETKKNHTPTFVRIDGDIKNNIMSYILSPSRREYRVKDLTDLILKEIGNMYPLSDKEIKKFVSRILEDFSDEQFKDFENNDHSYIRKIKQHIISVSEVYAEVEFGKKLGYDDIFITDSYTFPKAITPGDTGKDIPKSLYEKEGIMNGYEERVINEIANMDNILFWTRNIEKRGFRINGYINHYPDFIIQTKNNKTILLETKGDHLDEEQKIRLGNDWYTKAGNNYRYFMVYENRSVNGAYKLNDFLDTIRKL